MFRFRRFLFVSSATLVAGFSLIAPGRAWASPDTTAPPTTDEAGSSPTTEPSESPTTVEEAEPPTTEPTTTVQQADPPTTEPTTTTVEEAGPPTSEPTTTTVEEAGPPTPEPTTTTTVPEPEPIALVQPKCDASTLAARYTVVFLNPTSSIVEFDVAITRYGAEQHVFETVKPIHGETGEFVLSGFTDTSVSVSSQGALLGSAEMPAGTCVPDEVTQAVAASITLACDTPNWPNAFLIHLQNPTPYDVLIAMTLTNEGRPPYTEWVAIRACTDTVHERGTFNETGATLTVEFAGTALATSSHAAGDCAAASTPTSPSPTTTFEDETETSTTVTTSVGGDSGSNPTTTAVTTTTLAQQPAEPQHLPETGTSSVFVILIATASTVAGLALRFLASRR